VGLTGHIHDTMQNDLRSPSYRKCSETSNKSNIT